MTLLINNQSKVVQTFYYFFGLTAIQFFLLKMG